METEFDKTRLIEWVCWTFFGTCSLVVGRWLILKAVCLAGWGTPDWAAWVQAVGSIVAIAGAFLIARGQHRKDQAMEKQRLAVDKETARDNELVARTLTARNIVQVGTHALESLKSLVDAQRSDGHVWEADMHAARLDQLRLILDTFVSPGAEHVAAVAALQISKALTLTLFDIRNLGGTMTETILERSDRRIADAQACLNRLVGHESKLTAMCEQLGLPLDRDQLLERRGH